MKLDDSGNIEWQKTIGGTGSDMLYNIVTTNDDGYFIAGDSDSPASGLKTENSRGGKDNWVIKLNSVGDIEWQKTIGGNDEDNSHSYSTIQCSDGGYILAGTSKSNISGEKSEESNGGFDAWVIRLTPIGDILWQKTIGGAGLNDGNNNVLPTLDGGFLLGGVSDSSNSGDVTETGNGSNDYWIVKLAPEELSVPNHDTTSAAVFPNPTNGNLSIAFQLEQTSTVITLFDVSGRKLFQKEYFDTMLVNDFHIDGSNGVYLLEIQNGRGGKSVYKIVKY